MVSTVKAALSETSLEPPEFSPVRWLEGRVVDDSAPQYLVPTQRRRGQLDGADISDLLVKIGDLGGGRMRPLLHWFRTSHKNSHHQLYRTRNVISDQ